MVKYHIIKFQRKVDDPTGDVEKGPGIHVSDSVTRDCREGICQSNNSISKMKSYKVLDAISLF